MYYAYKIIRGQRLQLIGKYTNPMDVPDDIYLNNINLSTSIDRWYRMDCQLLQRLIYGGEYPIIVKNLCIIEKE